MAIDPLGGTAGATGAAKAASGNSLSQLGADYQSFLTLLTAQISNQDPLKPMDSTTFVSQLAQLSQVEQAVASNSNLEAISTQLASLGSMAGVALIGREVTVPSTSFATDAQGPATIRYRTPDGAESATITIRAPDGTELRKLTDLPAADGELMAYAWDGRDKAGLPVPPDRLSLKVTATDPSGKEVGATAYARATVDRMTFEQGLATLHLSNGEAVLAGQIEAIH